jgi:hypothetical protein
MFKIDPESVVIKTALLQTFAGIDELSYCDDLYETEGEPVCITHGSVFGIVVDDMFIDILSGVIFPIDDMDDIFTSLYVSKFSIEDFDDPDIMLSLMQYLKNQEEIDKGLAACEKLTIDLNKVKNNSLSDFFWTKMIELLYEHYSSLKSIENILDNNRLFYLNEVYRPALEALANMNKPPHYTTNNEIDPALFANVKYTALFPGIEWQEDFGINHLKKTLGRYIIRFQTAKDENLIQ